MLPDIWTSTDLLKIESSNKRVKLSTIYGISLAPQAH